MSDRNPHQFSKNNTSAKYVSCLGDTENQDSSLLIQIFNKTTVYILLLGCFTSRILCVKIATPVLFNIIRYSINNCPMRCNTKQSIYYSASSLYMFRVSSTPIIRSTQNCNYSLRHWSDLLCSYLPPTWPSLATLEGGNCTYRRL